LLLRPEFQTEIALMIAHVASQLTQRYLPAHSSPGTSEDVQKFLATLTPADWMGWIGNLRDSFEIPWLNSLLTRRPEWAERITFYCASELKVIPANRAHLVLSNSALFPPLLREIADPPHALTVIGDPRTLIKPMISVVGARKASGFALRESFRLGKILSGADLVVASGGAFGCDIAVHQGVLAGGVRPAPIVVVFAGGLSSTYPRGNDYVFRQIIAGGGALVSERLWWAPPKPRDFATRNRVVSGVSPHLVVMQAGDRSGALITARMALEQGRDVWVLEHEPGDVRAIGGEKLIEQGARTFKGASAGMVFWPPGHL
jgi:DNA processing protein